MLKQEIEKAELTLSELEIIRQWFGVVQDVNELYLNPEDYVLAKRIYEILGMRVPNSIKDKIQS